MMGGEQSSSISNPEMMHLIQYYDLKNRVFAMLLFETNCIHKKRERKIIVSVEHWNDRVFVGSHYMMFSWPTRDNAHCPGMPDA